MKNRRILKMIILFFIMLLFCLICFLFYLAQKISNETETTIGTTVIRQEERKEKPENTVAEKDEETEVKITERLPIHASNSYLSNLISSNMGTRIIQASLDEGVELKNGYVSYNDGTIEIRKTLINTVRNIIFTKKFDGNIIKNVNLKTPLKEILEMYPETSFGSLKEEYLGYVTEDFYYFFYDDEVSVYGYTYAEEKKFEKLLEKYLEDKNLDEFVSSIKASLRYYDYLEYDPEIQKAHIMFSNRGFEIDIEDNNPKGIILYSNYYFTEKTKQYVKDGRITLREKQDAVEKIEKERRANR